MTDLDGGEPGPTLALLGGVHGDELEGVLAIRIVVRALAGKAFRGRLVYAAPAHPAAWAAGSRTGPADGKNLARVFPGNPHGSPTEQVAAHLTIELITGADLLIDLHSAGLGFDMPLLAGFRSTGDLARRSCAAARAFGAPLLWEHPEPSSGRSLSAADELGVPSLYVEGRGGGRLRQHDLDGYASGVLRVMAHWGMIDPVAMAVPPPGPVTVVRGDGNTDEGITAGCDGYFVAATEVGDHVTEGAAIGTILDESGRRRDDVTAPTAGIVMLLRRGARVHRGDTLGIVATVVAEPIDSALAQRG